MILSVPEEKCVATKRFATKVLTGPITLRFLASFVGVLVSLQSVFPLAQLHFRRLQLFFNKCGLSHEWEDTITLTKEAEVDVRWWASECTFPLNSVKMKQPQPDFIIHTDASITGCGTSCSQGRLASGTLSEAECGSHINYLELLAVFKAWTIVKE